MAITKRRFRVMAAALAMLALLIFCGMPFHQAAKAVAIVDDAIIAIVIAALAAFGITFTMTGGYQTVREWIRDKITESGIDFSGVKYGASSVGSLLLNNLFVRRISAFALYIQAELGLLDNSTTQIISPDSTLGDITLYRLPVYMPYDKLSYEWTYVTSNVPIYGTIVAFSSTSGRSWWFISPVSGGVIVRYTKNASTGEVTQEVFHNVDTVVGNYYVYKAESYGISRWETSGYNSYALQSDVNAALGNSDIVAGSSMLNAVTGSISIPTNQEIEGNGGILSLPVPWGQSMGGTLTDIPTLVLENELAGNTTLDLEAEGTVESQVSDTATAEQPYVGTSASEYQSPGLTDVFPFCIPFDLYDLISCLAADPEAPEISWRFYVPGICDEQIEIDLSRFDTVAQIVRTMELLLFIVGLAMVTRDKFLRG